MIDGRNADSAFYRSLHISYPGETDRLRAVEAGGQPGSAIVIHGLPNGKGRVGNSHVERWGDWTEGCVAVTNREMDELWTLVEEGTPIQILP